MLHKFNTHISGNSNCKSENKTSQSSVDSWRDYRYQGRQTNDNSRQEIETNGEPSVDCTSIKKTEQLGYEHFHAYLPTSNRMGLHSNICN